MRLFNSSKNKGVAKDLSLFNNNDEEKTDLDVLAGALGGNTQQLNEGDDLEDLINQNQNINNEIFLPGQEDKNDLKFNVKISDSSNESFDEGLVVFEFSSDEYPDIVSCSGNDPRVI